MFMLFDHLSNASERVSARESVQRIFFLSTLLSLLNFAQTFKLLKLQFKLDGGKRPTKTMIPQQRELNGEKKRACNDTKSSAIHCFLWYFMLHFFSSSNSYNFVIYNHFEKIKFSFSQWCERLFFLSLNSQCKAKSITAAHEIFIYTLFFISIQSDSMQTVNALWSRPKTQ